LKKSGDALLAIFFHAAFDADGRNADPAHDIDLLTDSLTDQLSREHGKGAAILFVMGEDGLDAKKVHPSSVFADDAEDVRNLGRPVGNQRQ
jgi:hypothetical protein